MKNRRRVKGAGLSLLALMFALPFCMGGCPEFRNESVDALETATRGLIDAAVNLYFDQLRTDNAG